MRGDRGQVLGNRETLRVRGQVLGDRETLGDRGQGVGDREEEENFPNT